MRSEEHTSELQSPCNLVCRLLLEKKKKQNINPTNRAHNTDTYQRLHPAACGMDRPERASGAVRCPALAFIACCFFFFFLNEGAPPKSSPFPPPPPLRI